MKWIVDAAMANATAAVPLAFVAWLTCRWIRHPSLKHAVWLAVLLKLISPPLYSLSIALPAVKPTTAEATENSAARGTIDTTLEDRPDEEGRAGGLEISDLQPPPVVEPASLPQTAAWAFSPADVGAAAAILWIAGAALWLTTALWRSAGFGRRLRFAEPAGDDLRRMASEVAAKLGVRTPEVRIVDARLAPFVWPTLRGPLVVVPRELIAGLTNDAVRTLLAHETAHIRRRDHLVRWLEMLALACFWWHPAAWLASRRLRQAEEECCDALVLEALPGSEQVYGRTLVDSIAFLSGSRRGAPQLASGFGEAARYERRLRMILNGERMKLSTAAKAVAAAALAATLGLSPRLEAQADAAPARTVDVVGVPTAAAGRADDVVEGVAIKAESRPAIAVAGRPAGADDVSARLDRLERIVGELAQAVRSSRAPVAAVRPGQQLPVDAAGRTARSEDWMVAGQQTMPADVVKAQPARPRAAVRTRTVEGVGVAKAIGTPFSPEDQVRQIEQRMKSLEGELKQLRAMHQILTQKALPTKAADAVKP